MRKIIALLTFITIILIGCEKDFITINNLIKYNTPVDSVTNIITKPVNHTISHNIGNNSLNLLIYKFNDGHKGILNNSTNVNDTFQYLKIISYYSQDYRQRNIHELEVYSNGVNIVLNQAIHDYEIFVKRNLSGQLTGVDLYQFIFNLRLIPNDSTILIYAQTESDVKEFMTDGNLISRWSSKRIESDTNYIGLDTVTVVFDLRKSSIVDSIKLYLGGWMQVYDLMISNNNVDWKYLECTHNYITSLDSIYNSYNYSAQPNYGYDVLIVPVDSLTIIPVPVDTITIPDPVVPVDTITTIPDPVDTTIIIIIVPVDTLTIPDPVDTLTIIPDPVDTLTISDL